MNGPIDETMRDTLARLARQALDDPDARAVLQDAIEETGWSSRTNGIRVYVTMYPKSLEPGSFPVDWDGGVVRDWFRLGFQFAAEGSDTGRSFIAAIGAVLRAEDAAA